MIQDTPKQKPEINLQGIGSLKKERWRSLNITRLCQGINTYLTFFYATIPILSETFLLLPQILMRTEKAKFQICVYQSSLSFFDLHHRNVNRSVHSKHFSIVSLIHFPLPVGSKRRTRLSTALLSLLHDNCIGMIVLGKCSEVVPYCLHSSKPLQVKSQSLCIFLILTIITHTSFRNSLP